MSVELRIFEERKFVREGAGWDEMLSGRPRGN